MVKNKPGFTIIEVVLVLAIAGLIFLMVFIALPALQRSQRDTQRRDDIARFATAIAQYQTNNGGQLSNSINKYAVWAPPYLPWANSHGTYFASTKESKCSTSKCSTTGRADKPFCVCGFVKSYLNASGATENTFKDPNGNQCNIVMTDFKNDGSLSMPSLSSDWKTEYLEKNDSNGKFSISGTQQHIVFIVTGGKCDGEEVERSGSSTSFAILYKLEGAGSYCSDNV